VQELRGIPLGVHFRTQQNSRSHPAMSTSIVNKLARGALEEIGRIVRNSVVNPVGPEYMAPLARVEIAAA
jgi:homogentisate 1,2-dioxygenase